AQPGTSGKEEIAKVAVEKAQHRRKQAWKDPGEKAGPHSIFVFLAAQPSQRHHQSQADQAGHGQRRMPADEVARDRQNQRSSSPRYSSFEAAPLIGAPRGESQLSIGDLRNGHD